VLRGETKYFDDLQIDNLAHVVFVRSNVAHARLEQVDTSEAEAMPGVLAVYTADSLELPDQQGFAMLPPVFNRPPLARGVVRFVGDVIAAVVAETRAQAVDAAELVIVDYDPLPVVIDPEGALAAESPVVFPEHGSNLAFEMNFGSDPTVFEGADLVVSEVFYNQRVAGVPMEGNGIIAAPGAPEGGLTAWIPTQAPNGSQEPLASALGIDASAVRVVAPAVGGGFGPKAGIYVEHLVVAKAAMMLGRPLKWTETRSA
jgi:carbon-monoxide dehydrogenase large subunit